jgi:hypothetical protein
MCDLRIQHFLQSFCPDNGVADTAAPLNGAWLCAQEFFPSFGKVCVVSTGAEAICYFRRNDSNTQ